MNVKPTNRNLLIKIPEEKAETEKTTFILPEDYNRKVERYKLVQVLDRAEDCEKIKENCKCIVETSMINQIKVHGQNYHIVGENYVVLVVE